MKRWMRICATCVLVLGLLALGLSSIDLSLYQIRGFLNETIGSKDIDEVKKNSLVVKWEDEVTQSDITIGSGLSSCIDINLNKQLDDYYNVDENTIRIIAGGAYKLSGEVGQIVIDVYDDENVQLIFDSVDIQTQGGPALMVENANKVTVTLEGENLLRDSAKYDGEYRACVFSNADLTINGSGKLEVFGYKHDGIRSKDRVKIVGTNVAVHAKNNGVRGNDGVLIYESVLDIQSEGVGIKAASDKDYVIVQGGECKIIAGLNAIEAEKQVTVQECNVDFYSVEEKIKCNGVKEIDE